MSDSAVPDPFVAPKIPGSLFDAAMQEVYRHATGRGEVEPRVYGEFCGMMVTGILKLADDYYRQEVRRG